MASVAAVIEDGSESNPSSCRKMLHEDCAHCSKQERCAFLSLPQVGGLGSPFVVSQYAAGQTIISQAGPNVGLHLVCKGLVAVSRAHQRECKCQSILYLVGTGEFIMPTENLLAKSQHGVSAQALTASTVLFMRHEALQAVLFTEQSFVRLFLRQMAEMWSSLEERYLVRDCADAGRRLAHALVSLARMVGQPTAGGVLIPVNLNRSFLAHAIGATPETIGRQMSQFRSEEVLSYSEDEIVIHQLDRLQSFAEG